MDYEDYKNRSNKTTTSTVMSDQELESSLPFEI